MRQSLAIAAALASTATAQSATALTFWNPGPANNPSLYSNIGFGSTTYPPVASVVSSNPATTIFALGCPSSVPASLSRIPNGNSYETCSWATDSGRYTIINSTRHVMHRSDTEQDYSMWWTCDHNTVATQVTCAVEVACHGKCNDDTGGPVSDIVYPDKAGNIVVFATAEVVTDGRFGELDCGVGYGSIEPRPCNSDGTGGKPSGSTTTGLMTASGSPPTVTATQGSGVEGLEPTNTASGNVATESTGAAAKYSTEGAAAIVLIGAAMLCIL